MAGFGFLKTRLLNGSDLVTKWAYRSVQHKEPSWIRPVVILADLNFARPDDQVINVKASDGKTEKAVNNGEKPPLSSKPFFFFFFFDPFPVTEIPF